MAADTRRARYTASSVLGEALPLLMRRLPSFTAMPLLAVAAGSGIAEVCDRSSIAWTTASALALSVPALAATALVVAQASARRRGAAAQLRQMFARLGRVVAQLLPILLPLAVMGGLIEAAQRKALHAESRLASAGARLEQLERMWLGLAALTVVLQLVVILAMPFLILQGRSLAGALRDALRLHRGRIGTAVGCLIASLFLAGGALRLVELIAADFGSRIVAEITTVAARAVGIALLGAVVACLHGQALEARRDVEMSELDAIFA